MKVKRKIIQELTLSQNYQLAKTTDLLTFKELAKRAGVGENTAFRMVSRTPVFVTSQLLKVGKALGFSEKNIREKARTERLKNKEVYSKKERLYQLITEIIHLFETKAGK